MRTGCVVPDRFLGRHTADGRPSACAGGCAGLHAAAHAVHRTKPSPYLPPMSLPDDPTLHPADRWDRRYRALIDAGDADREPNAFLLEQAHLIPTSGRALDIAAGLGPNALWLGAPGARPRAGQKNEGLHVTAIDISPIACEYLRGLAADRRLPIRVLCRDLEKEPLPAGLFDVILNVLYLQRSLMPQLEERLAPGGLLIVVTLLEGGSGPPPVHKEYLLQRDELLMLFPNLQHLLFRKDPTTSDRPYAYLAARKPGKP